MGDKNKGKQAGKGKKPKMLKVGHRPHEVRQREAMKGLDYSPAKPVL